MANRVWFHLVGRGIVDPPDDFRDSNPPSNPELLEYLTDEFVSSGYSIKRLERIILSSRFFQRQGISQQSEMEGLPLVSVFAGFPIRRLPAEVLLDAVSDATGVPTSFRKGKRDEGENVPDLIIERAVRFAAIPRTAGFLKTFGKPDRLLTCECERSTDSSLTQSLAMLNGPRFSRDCSTITAMSPNGVNVGVHVRRVGTPSKRPTPHHPQQITDQHRARSNFRAFGSLGRLSKRLGRHRLGAAELERVFASTIVVRLKDIRLSRFRRRGVETERSSRNDSFPLS